jgi:hypothetical protein
MLEVVLKNCVALQDFIRDYKELKHFTFNAKQ